MCLQRVSTGQLRLPSKPPRTPSRVSRGRMVTRQRSPAEPRTKASSLPSTSWRDRPSTLPFLAQEVPRCATPASKRFRKASCKMAVPRRFTRWIDPKSAHAGIGLLCQV